MPVAATDAVSTEKSERLLKGLIAVGQELSSTTELSALLEKILAVSREVFRFDNAIIRLLDEDGQRLTAVSAYGYTVESVERTIEVGQGVMGRVAACGKPVLVEDVRICADYVPGIAGALSELAVPLFCRDKLIGVFNVESPRVGAFNREDVALLMTLAGQAAIAIENARLYERLRGVSQRYQELHEANDRILRSVNLGIYTVDANLVITSWNRRMEEMSGLNATQVIGRSLATLFPGLVEEGVVERIELVLASGKPGKLRLLHRNHDGQDQIQKRRLAPLRDGEQVTGVAVIVEDITEFQKLLDQTVQSEKLVEVGRLSAGIAHEINNPLGVIMYAAELLMREAGLTPFQQEMAERIIDEVGRLRVLTGGLLSFSQPCKAMNRLVDVSALVEEVLQLVRYELLKQSIQLETDFATLPVISADPNKLKQVVINLIMNAAQALGHGGKITLTTGIYGGDEVELVISDTGPGIEPALQEQVFKPFFTTKADGEGTGLGLYICANIIKEHGGSIQLDSKVGQGATFRLRLPAA